MSTPKRPKRPADFMKRAYQVFQEGIGEAPAEEPATEVTQPPKPEREKDPAAVALGRKGGLKGGKARFAGLSAEERSEVARKAAFARWSKKDNI